MMTIEFTKGPKKGLIAQKEDIFAKQAIEAKIAKEHKGDVKTKELKTGGNRATKAAGKKTDEVKPE